MQKCLNCWKDRDELTLQTDPGATPTSVFISELVLQLNKLNRCLPLQLKVPTLMKATADDENPCPGYLFQEIGSILW